MDTNKDYILMCLKAKPIIDHPVLNRGDYYAFNNGESYRIEIWDVKPYTITEREIWLPRMDQLAEMIQNWNKKYSMAFFQHVAANSFPFTYDRAEITIEQHLLMMYMLEQYDLIWTEEETWGKGMPFGIVKDDKKKGLLIHTDMQGVTLENIDSLIQERYLYKNNGAGFESDHYNSVMDFIKTQIPMCNYVKDIDKAMEIFEGRASRDAKDLERLQQHGVSVPLVRSRLEAYCMETCGLGEGFVDSSIHDITDYVITYMEDKTLASMDKAMKAWWESLIEKYDCSHLPLEDTTAKQ